MTLGCEVAGYRQNAGVVVTDLEAAGQDRGIGVVEFHAQRPAVVQGTGWSRRPAEIRRSSSRRSAVREAAEFGVASSSAMTTAGNTTSCSPKRRIAWGSESRTLVSMT